jgi:hypothetical protein
MNHRYYYKPNVNQAFFPLLTKTASSSSTLIENIHIQKSMAAPTNEGHTDKCRKRESGGRIAILGNLFLNKVNGTDAFDSASIQSHAVGREVEPAGPAKVPTWHSASTKLMMSLINWWN